MTVLVNSKCLGSEVSCWVLSILTPFTVRYKRRLAEEAAGCSERRSSCHDKDQVVRPHYASLARTSLASGSQSHRLQASGDGVQVSARTGATIPGC